MKILIKILEKKIQMIKDFYRHLQIIYDSFIFRFSGLLLDIMQWRLAKI